MEIYGAGGTQGPQPIYPRLAAFSLDAGQAVHAGAPRDHVEISPLGKMLDGIGQLPEIRHERVDEIRRQIAAGSYEVNVGGDVYPVAVTVKAPYDPAGDKIRA